MPNQFDRSRVIPAITLLFFSVMFNLFSSAQASETLMKTDAALQLHIDLIEVALKTDSYNKRCRGISTATNLHEVNRLYVTKYSITANNFIKDYINEDVRAFKTEREHTINKLLAKIGGCEKAESQEWVKQLKPDFKRLYEQAESDKLPWYPE
ncbi:hypothetical protein [Thiomicrorhabdus arctica]|uniref:hypothetical protein n=1 Tax=Thiomicrorhabdus arctica TaxID=131540 RepID=UPI000366A135|nr:hypothetical protein [Thiomicrorhabdus arctica]